ncbi:DUF2157 domain-containing protein [Paenisporosarcina antarctica]|uniref:DUF2157 domain-containing protein n=1 Tax=Paenisporosarcina antarctica TaxID=417367 RepID=A0A4P6ZVS2_9BACL|nr:DUF2157 domain-containing protein [Paenisporosarcina antarctica]QBP40274.1 DUF2157 domain-containing protein [Paenisporosarcina antarctica]
MEINRKLERWQNEGFIDQTTVDQILAFEHLQPKPKKLPLLLIIGLIFFSLAVFSFIAANWQVMPDMLRITLVLLLMWMFYGFGYLSEQKKFGQPLIFRLIGLGMFAASIIITIQTFHLSISNSILPWAIFIAALAHYFYWRHQSYAIIGFIFGAQVLITSVPTIGWLEWGSFIIVSLVWFYFSRNPLPMVFSWLLLFGSGLMLWSLIDYKSVLWPVWTLFALVVLLFLVPEKERILRPLYLIIGGIQLVVYLAVRGETPLSFVELNLTESISLIIVATGILALCYIRFRAITWISVLGFVGVLLFDDTAIGLAILAEVVALAYLIITHRQEKPLALGFVYFIAVQFVLYFIYAWERLDMSLFFLIGALLLFALSGIAWRMNRKKVGVSS